MSFALQLSVEVRSIKTLLQLRVLEVQVTRQHPLELLSSPHVEDGTCHSLAANARTML